ncbi:MAG: sodium-translocating pyrophosphatase [Ruminococcaceae bacterium]|nr:sodium-translocating pyrophosphatase [Oscillospiraceae bacterium]
MGIELVLGLVIVAALAGLAYACANFFSVKKLPEGNERMQEIAGEIRLGANTFINYEYRVVAVVAAIIVVVLAALISWSSAVSFITGAVMSAIAGYIGMKIATYANVRVTNKALTSKSLSETLKVAFKGGSVMGLCVAGFALLGVFIVFIVFGVLLKQIDAAVARDGSVALASSFKSIVGMFTDLNLGGSFTMTLSSYALGCSIIALFNRMGGGIYTKAADMGADLVGKTEAHLPEDDPRNPATIADNVGDNVGDVAGLGSDLLESFVGAMLSGTIMAIELFTNLLFHDTALLKALIYFPLALAGIGLIGCVLGIASLFIRKKLSSNPHKELNAATWVSAGITMIVGFVASYFIFGSLEVNLGEEIGFRFGWVSPMVGAAIGIVAGIVIGKLAEYYTSADFKPTQGIAKSSVQGPALTVTQGLAVGMISCMWPCIVLGLSIFISFIVAGPYGVAAAAMGMLSFVATTVSVDAYGPISDNAGGIAEMSYLPEEVRDITDTLDSVGNTTAAIGKGFAIGSAAMAVLCMMTSYMFSFNHVGVNNPDFGIDQMFDGVVLNVINPLGLTGAIFGAAMPFLFSGMLINAVAKAAQRMVDEVRRQFREIPGLLQGTARPDTKTCIQISTQGAIKEMTAPAVLAIAFPVACGFIFGAEFVGGILVGATLSAIMLAIFCGNAGGAWDNGKKYIETGVLGAENGKGSATHDAGVVGDTVGDPLKDTVGPCLDILIKIMSNLALVMGSAFASYNLYDIITK